MSIDHAKLREHAVELQRLLAHYAPLEPEVAMLQRQLAPLLEPILDGTALLPYDRIPGGRQLLESKLGLPYANHFKPPPPRIRAVFLELNCCR